jgi:AAA domain
MTNQVNDHLVLICGKSAVGKTASLMNLKNPEGVMYLNCESGKRTPFKAKFKQYTISDPLQIYEAFSAAENMPDVHTIVVDSLSMLMELFESVYVVGSANTMAQWGAYSQYFKNLMQQYVAKSTKNVIFTAHTVDSLNESEMVMETKVPVKGSLKGVSLEAYFSVIVYAKKMSLKALKDFKTDMLSITPEEESLGYKHVFQCRITKETVNERIRGPMGMFNQQETYMDNDAGKLMQRLKEYYD